MADITATAAKIAPVFPTESRRRNFIANAAVTAGQPLYMLTTGKVAPADANAAGLQQVVGIAMETVAANDAVSVLERGELYGYDLSALNYGARVYLSDTVGSLADAAGTMTVVVGQVRPLTTVGGFTKVLYVSVDPTRIWA